jgi:hypothetical protein
MSWIVERRLLVPLGIVVVLLGAFVPLPNIAIAALVVILGAGMMLAQIPLAFRESEKVERKLQEAWTQAHQED